MPGRYQPAETIKSVIEKIDTREWILPSIQRRFVWDTDRIENLFDSIMQGYPIGTLMVWKVTSKETIKKIGFYNFLQDYQERWAETCTDYKPSSEIVYSVIDGQQRLNSLYIGLKGSYAEKLPRKRWHSAYDSSIQPKKYLYLNLCEHHSDNEENRRFYNLKFMSNAEYKDLVDKCNWYKVANILDDFPYFDESRLDDDEFLDLIDSTIDKMGIDSSKRREATKTFKKLYKVIFASQVINYYLEEDNDLDRVVDIFVRTNSGGVPLAFSDLVMSVIVSEWPEARTKIDELVTLVRTETGIDISRDFILKAFLYIYSADIKFRIGNLTSNLVEKIKDKLEEVGEYIKSVCFFAKQIGLNDDAIRAKYALLPLLYYSYKNEIKLDNLAKYPEDRKNCGVFLKLSLIKGLFGGSPDSSLMPIRSKINEFNGRFPMKEISDYFIGRPRNLNLSDEDIEARVNEACWGTNDARLLLSIITEINPEYSYDHVDHLYPKSMFTDRELNEMEFLKDNPELKAFYADKKNWNTLGNLQLLNSAENESKNHERLSSWLSRKPEYKSSIILPKDAAGNDIFADDKFKEFFEGRKKLLCKLLKEKTTF